MPGAGFEHTPLWYYVLREAEKSPGDHLGPVGSYIVANTLVGLLVADKDSYWQSGEGEDRVGAGGFPRRLIRSTASQRCSGSPACSPDAKARARPRRPGLQYMRVNPAHSLSL